MGGRLVQDLLLVVFHTIQGPVKELYRGFECDDAFPDFFFSKDGSKN